MEKRIYYHDTDAGGVVYYGRYLNYLEEARTEFLEDRGLSVAEFQKKGRPQVQHNLQKPSALRRNLGLHSNIKKNNSRSAYL